MSGKNNINSIDLFKLLMAIAVVAIHTNPIANWTNPAAIKIVMIIEEWAVPFFFIASGFLLFRAMKEPYKDEIKRIDRYILKILKMYCAWTLISLPLSLYGYAVSGNSLLSCVLSYIKYFLFVGKLYNSYHLWYLLALLYALICIRMMTKKGISSGIIVVLSYLIFFLAQVMSVLSENSAMLGRTAEKIVSLYSYVFNGGGVFTGMAYVCAGMLIARYGIRIDKRLGIVGIAALNIAKLFVNDFIAQLLMPFEAALLFMVVLDIRLPDCKAWIKCREASTVIYLSHLIFYSIYTFLIIKEPNKLGFDSFIVTLLLSLLNAAVLNAMKRSGRFKLVGYII